ncbi:PREDICTED: uncharacterized protein LOC109213779 [Nicotiana attenuata]|uniref:uncharacterized protein LOC109213779 n=1 Tax=Nicotiana attenuata TaxID=49451 RepID=UPI000905B6A7|nr:PREDICTED: uncharacterized protein LOC109213779 [Nicotiana attenuata]
MLLGKSADFRGKRPGIICEHCGYKGHLKENCFKIIGYPADFRSKRKNQTGGGKVYTNSVNVNNEENKVAAVQAQGNGQFFTEEQYKQLVQLLSKPATPECSTNMTDTGATHHVTYTKDIPSNMRRTYDQGRSEVQLPTGNKAQITHTGEASILGNKTVKNVLYVPYFKFNLLSMSKLTKDLSCTATFFPDFRMFQDLYSGRVMGIGREHNGLYLLKENITVVVAGFLVNKGAESKLWHLRLGHASLKSMQHILELRNKVDMQLGVNVKVLRSDNGSEFFNSQCNELLASLGIIHQSSCPYTPQQNGTVERKHKHILEVVRALMFQSSVPMRFWGDCVRTAAYFINKLTTRVLQRKCSYEMLHNKPTKIEHLRVFGCLCFASNLPGGDKFSPRARKSVLIGYSKTQKGYRLFDLNARKVFISRDVSFREQVFPFKEGTQITEDLFPCEPLIPNDSLPEHSLQTITEESNSSGAHGQVEAAQAPVMEPTAAADTQTLDSIEDAVDSVDTIDPTETIDVQSDTYPLPGQSLTERVASETTDVRKSSGTTRPSMRLKDYVTSSNTQKHPHCISNNVSYCHLLTHYQA